MKRIIFSATLILTFCFFAFGQTENNPNCPKIKVTGPASVVHLGETMTFTVNVSDVDLDKIKYQWSVSDGTINEGQGTPVIYVETSGASKTEITVTVKIQDLPDGCSNSVSEKVELCKYCGHPVMLDDYGKILWKDEKARLKTIAASLLKEDQMALYFVVYYTANETKRTLKNRILRMQDVLVKDNNVPKEKLVFVFGGVEESERTRVWLVPYEGELKYLDWTDNLNKLEIPLKN